MRASWAAWVGILGLAACGGGGGGGGGGSSGTRFIALDAANHMIHYDSGSPAVPLASVTILGLGLGERVVGIDFRPLDGQLFGLAVDLNGTGTAGRVLVIDPTTGATVQVGTGFVVPTAAPDGGYGVDFNPQTDRMRVVNTADANFRVNPITGALVQADVALNPAAQGVEALAYDRNVSSGGMNPTSAYALNPTSAALVTLGGIDGLPSANTGTLTPVGPLGVAVDPGQPSGLDIVGSSAAYAVFDGDAGPGTAFGLYTVDLGTGAATLVGPIGPGTVQIQGITVLP